MLNPASRLTILLATLGAGLAAPWAAVPALAADYPTHTVSILVGFAAGGSTDLLARLVGQGLAAKWGQPVVVENKPGANASIAAAEVAHAAPDGYTLLWVGNPLTIVLPELKLTYDPVKSFAPITEIAAEPDLFLASPTLPANSLKELVALAKAKPHQLNFGSPGRGTLPSLEMDLFMKKTGIEMTEVPYTGSAPLFVALEGGEIQVTLGSFSGGQSQVQAGKMKALAISSATASPQMPQVQPVAVAAGLPGFQAVEWYGAVAPAGTPPAIVAKLHDDMVAVMHSAAVSQRLATLGFTPVGNSPAAFAKVIADDTAQWSAVLAAMK